MKKYCIQILLIAGIFPIQLLALDLDPALATARNHLNNQELIQARDAFAAVVAQDPANQKAHAMLGVTGLLSLYADPRAVALMDTWQVDPIGRDIYNWEADFTDPDNLPPAGSTSGDLQDFLVDVLLSEIVIAGERLANVTDTNFELRLKPENLGQPSDPSDEVMVVDYADALLIRAGLKAVEFALRIGIASNDLNVSFDAIRQLADSDLLTAARVLEDNLSLLTVKDAQQRVLGGEALTGAIDLYYEASPLLRQTGRDDRLFVLDPEDWAEEDEFREILETVEAALEEPVDIGEDDDSFFVDLSPLVSAEGPDVRSLLPSIVENKALEGSLPDATFGGVLLDMTPEWVERELLRNNLLLTWKPSITKHPGNRVADPGETVVLTVEADAAAPFQYQWKKGDVELAGENGPALTLDTVDVSNAGYYSVAAWNEFGTAVSRQARVVVTVPLAEALDAPGLEWTTGGYHGWIGQTLVALDGVSAAESNPAHDFSTGWMETTVTGPGTLTFWWKLQHGLWWSELDFYGVGFHARHLNLESDWVEEVVEVPEGIQTLQWRFALNRGGRGWVDQVSFSGGSPSGGFAEWAEALPIGQRGQTDDPGGHGIYNLLRYAFGMDAIQPNRADLPQIGTRTVMVDDSPEVRLSLTYTRRTNDPELQYTIDASDDLFDWLSLEAIEDVSDDGNGETETVVVTDVRALDGQDKRFLRVNVGY